MISGLLEDDNVAEGEEEVKDKEEVEEEEEEKEEAAAAAVAVSTMWMDTAAFCLLFCLILSGLRGGADRSSRRQFFLPPPFLTK